MLQPNSRDCFVCGLENLSGLRLQFYVTGPDEVSTTTRVPDHFQGYPGTVHGGVVAALLDEVVSRAAMSTDPAASRFMVTARLNLRFRRRVPVGRDLKVVGRITRFRQNSVRATGTIEDEHGQILAEADAVLVDMPEEARQSLDADRLGWRVYPEIRSRNSAGSV